MPQPKQIYYPRCQTCAYMKKNQDWYKQLLQTSYYDEASPETPGQFYARTAPPFPQRAYYRHLQNHSQKVKEKLAREAIRKAKNLATVTQQHNIELDELQRVVEVESKSDYTGALDDIIRKFHADVKSNRIKVTGGIGMQAIKLRADIDKGKKDQKIDVLKMFAGRNGKSRQQ